jgi:hypothetical protein
MEKNSRNVWRQIMYYIKFNESGVQEEAKWSDETLGDGWYLAGEEIEGKTFKLTSSGKASAMTTAQLKTYKDGLERNSAIQDIKIIRMQLLLASDWTQLPDNGLTDSKKSEWQVYRQLLRDLPTTIGDDLSYTLPPMPQ